MAPADGDFGEGTSVRLTRRLGAPGATAPVPAPAASPAAPAAPTAAPAGGDKVRGSLYMTAGDKATLMWMVKEVFHDARGATTKHGALGAIIHVVRADWERIRAEALAEIHRPKGEQQ